MKADGLKTYPFFFEGSAEQANCTLWQQAQSAGVPVMTAGFKPQMTNANIERSVAWLVSMQNQGLVPPSVPTSGYAQGITVFQQDIAAMGEQWNAGAINLVDRQQSPGIYDKMGFAVLPYDPAGGPSARRLYTSVWSLGVSSYSQYPEAAFEYAAWFSSPEIARETVLKGGGSSGRQSLLHEPSILAANPQYKALADSFASTRLGLLPPLPLISSRCSWCKPGRRYGRPRRRRLRSIQTWLASTRASSVT